MASLLHEKNKFNNKFNNNIPFLNSSYMRSYQYGLDTVSHQSLILFQN